MSSSNDIRQAVILVGGRGTRMWPLTDRIPKALLPLAGVPFLEYQTGLLAEAGVEEVFLAVGHEHEAAWRQFVADWDGMPALNLSFEDTPLDTAGPVAALLRRLDDRFLVLNGDVVFDTSLRDFLESAPPDQSAVLALATVTDPSAYGVVVLDGHRVDRFVEKPAPGTEPANTVNAGIYILDRRGLADYPAGRLSFERTVFPDAVQRGDISGVVVEGTWLDIGTPQLYLAAHATVMTGHTSFRRDASLHATGLATTMGGRQEGDWSWIGDRCTIAPGALVRESVVLDGVHVGEGAVVEQAIVGWEAEIMPGAVVAGATMVGEGSVVGPGCELDAGMRLAPGTKLGPRSVTFRPPQ